MTDLQAYLDNAFPVFVNPQLDAEWRSVVAEMCDVEDMPDRLARAGWVIA